MDMTDEEIDAMFESDYGEMTEEAPVPPPREQSALAPVPVVPLFPITLAQAQAPPSEENGGLIRKRIGGVPVWGWGLIGIGLGGAGWFYWKSQQRLQPNEPTNDEPALGDRVSLEEGASTGWRPSRSAFGDQLRKYFARKGHAQHVVVWDDAEDAQKQGKMKFVSPLINIQVKGGTVKADAALTRFCRRDGLNPVQHQDGSIGLYPHSSKRGKEWEEYIDALRDEGQKV